MSNGIKLVSKVTKESARKDLKLVMRDELSNVQYRDKLLAMSKMDCIYEAPVTTWCFAAQVLPGKIVTAGTLEKCVHCYV